MKQFHPTRFLCCFCLFQFKNKSEQSFQETRTFNNKYFQTMFLPSMLHQCNAGNNKNHCHYHYHPLWGKNTDRHNAHTQKDKGTPGSEGAFVPFPFQNYNLPVMNVHHIIRRGFVFGASTNQNLSGCARQKFAIGNSQFAIDEGALPLNPIIIVQKAEPFPKLRIDNC